VSRGWKFFIGYGPDEHGKIPPIMQERLLEMVIGEYKWRSDLQYKKMENTISMERGKNKDWKTDERRISC
jgi:hypothetical protein